MAMQIKKLGIYIHIPFCASKCAYCDFYSRGGGSEELQQQMNLYQKALLSHFKALSQQGRGYAVDTVYFGGGTPTFYGATRIDGLLRGLRKTFRIQRDAEITVEGNPDSMTAKTVEVLRRSGVNRISMGMQSAVAQELLAIGRGHSPQITREAVGILKHQQMKNLSLDLIYGLPQQTLDSWKLSVEEALALEPQHLSCYGLKVEEGTPLYHRVAQGEVLPDDDLQADCYLWMVERLKEKGYHQYEVSNFALEGYHSRHNLGYWLGKPFLGFGASASSDFGGYRYRYVEDLQQYCQCVLEGGSIFSSNDFVTEGERREEYIYLRLRTSDGITPQAYEKYTGNSFLPLERKLTEYAREGWTTCNIHGVWQLTPQGFLRSNLILGDLLDAVQTPTTAVTSTSLFEDITTPSHSTSVPPTSPCEKTADLPEEERENQVLSEKKTLSSEKESSLPFSQVLEEHPLSYQEGEDGQFFF